MIKKMKIGYINLKPDGELVFDFYFGVSDEPLEDKKQWVLAK
jgi:hypothetical protein